MCECARVCVCVRMHACVCVHAYVFVCVLKFLLLLLCFFFFFFFFWGVGGLSTVSVILLRTKGWTGWLKRPTCCMRQTGKQHEAK